MPLNDTWTWDGSGWTERIPKPGVVGQLNNVTCTGDGNCWAVGGQLSSAGGAAFIEHSNGRAWTAVASQNPPGSSSSALFGVACASVTNCWAVGAYDTTPPTATLPYAEHWNGKAWSEVAMPAPHSNGLKVTLLQAVACPSATLCFADGTGERLSGKFEVSASLIERWNGQSWQIVPSPALPHSNTTGLDGLSCTSGTDCWAVGGWASYNGSVDYKSGGLGDHWNGQQWTAERVGRPGNGGKGLSSVSCPAAGMCMATGLAVATDSPFAVRWNGSSWVAAPIGAISGALDWVNGVSCPSPQRCEAVGYTNQASASSLVEQWNGSSWARVPSPNVPKGGGVFEGVACPQVSDCWAVGWYAVGEPDKVLIEHWNGTAWTIKVP
jgi:hypothetical protein